jgi:hypothetical protein
MAALQILTHIPGGQNSSKEAAKVRQERGKFGGAEKGERVKRGGVEGIGGCAAGLALRAVL